MKSLILNALSLSLVFTTGALFGQDYSKPPPIAPGSNCATMTTCPDIGVDTKESKVKASEQGATCDTGTWQINVGGVKISGSTPPNVCPFFYIYTPPCGFQVTKKGHCINSSQWKKTLKFDFGCICVQWLVFICLDYECRQTGGPTSIDINPCFSEGVCPAGTEGDIIDVSDEVIVESSEISAESGNVLVE